MKLHAAFAGLSLAAAASADLSYSFTFEDYLVEDNGFINGFVFSDLTSEYAGETLTSVDFDVSFYSEEGGSLRTFMFVDGAFDSWFSLNGSAGVDDLAVTAETTASFAGSWDASAFGIVLDGQPAYLMGAGAAFFSDSTTGSGILNGTITFNMTPAPGALALLGMAGLGRRKRS